MPNTRENTTREMTFEEEAKFYEAEARAEFAKENGNCEPSFVNSILRRGMRIIRKARKEIANGVTVQEWISVEDRLPEKIGEHILVCYSDGWVCDQYTPADDGVTHWMPLPEAPKGE